MYLLLLFDTCELYYKHYTVGMVYMYVGQRIVQMYSDSITVFCSVEDINLMGKVFFHTSWPSAQRI